MDRTLRPFVAESAPVLFSLSELWLLQSVVRHEIAQQSSWQKPPANLALNEAIADAIYSCVEYGYAEVALQLTAHHLLIIDALVPQAAKDADGKLLGKPILLKSFAARRALTDGGALDTGSAAEPEQPSFADIHRIMEDIAAHYCAACGSLKAAPQKGG